MFVKTADMGAEMLDSHVFVYMDVCFEKQMSESAVLLRVGSQKHHTVHIQSVSLG